MLYSPNISNSDRSSTAETTPIGTPRGFGTGTGHPRRLEKEKDTFGWSSNRFGGGNSVDILEVESDDSNFPSFDDTTSHFSMGSNTTPIDIGSSREGTGRPAMYAALNQPGSDARSSNAMSIGSGYSRFGHRDSVSASQPISMQNASNQNKPRRESLAGSMVTGMSWGGASVGSWIRDEYVLLYPWF